MPVCQVTAIAVSVRTCKVRWTLTKMGEQTQFFPRHLLTIVLQVFSFGQLVIVFAVLFVIHSSDTHRPLFIEWHKQASYVLLLIKVFVNVSWYTKHWHLTFTYAIPSTAVVFIPFWREKEREGYLLSSHRQQRKGWGIGQSLAVPFLVRLLID